jgi:hypothetical protein
MGDIYDDQTDLTIRLETEKPLAGITDVKIAYRNPQNEKGEFSAVVVDAVKGIISHAITAPLKAGEWILWAKVTNTQGLVSIGKPTVINVIKTGKL